MKILHIINSLGGGGAEKLIEGIVPLLNKKGINNRILLLTNNKNVFEDGLKEAGIEIRILPSGKLYSPMNIHHIRKFIIDGEYDIVHAHLFPTIYWVSLASRLIHQNKPKFVMTEHSTHNRRRNKKYLRAMEEFIYFGYDTIISISQQTQNKLVVWLKPQKDYIEKFTVVENGVDIESFAKALPYKRSEINSEFTEATKLLCMVGRFSKAKDQPTLIRAMKYMGEDVHLLLVGRGPLEDYNRKLARDIGVNDHVHFLGFRDDVERVLKTSDVIIQSSNWEGFGLAAVEGMAAGKPVIASDVPGLSEVVSGHGAIFPRGDYLALAQTIRCLLAEEKKYKYVSDACLDRARDFDISTTAGLYVNVYRKYFYTPKVKSD